MSGKNVKAGGAYVELGVKDQLDAALKQVQAKLNRFAKSAGVAGAALSGAGAAITGPLAAAATMFGATGANFDDISQRSGVSGKKLSEYAYAAEVAGTSIETVEGGLKKMAKTLFAADEESKKAVESLAHLGLNVEELKGLSPDKQFEAIADAIAKVEDPTRKTALAMQIFGGSGSELIPMLNGGSKGLANMAAQAEKLGVSMSDEAIASAATLDDNLLFLQTSLKGFTLAIGEAVAGPLSALVEGLTAIIAQAVAWAKENEGLVQIIAGVGAALVAAGSILAGFAGAALVVSTAISGVSAVLGAVLSPIGLVVAGIAGIGVALYAMTDVFDPVVKWISDTFDWLSGVVGQTMAGIQAALSTGDLGKAAAIAFGGVRLVVGATMESVLGIFGTSIEEMSGLLAELYKQIGTILGRLNEARVSASNVLASGLGWLAGVNVSDENRAASEAAAAFTKGFEKIDTKQLGQSIAGLFDPAQVQAELDALTSEAIAAAQAATPTPAPALAAPEMPALADAQKTIEQAQKSQGSFSASALNQAVGKDFAKDTAKNTGETVKKLEQIVSLLPMLAVKFQ